MAAGTSARHIGGLPHRHDAYRFGARHGMGFPWSGTLRCETKPFVHVRDRRRRHPRRRSGIRSHPTGSTMKVLIAVTHLLGAGHLSRALTLARAMVAMGHQVTVLSGGRSAPHLPRDGINFVQLPPVASDGTNFTRLLDTDGAEAGPELFAERLARATREITNLQPDALITELYPFGRRILADEFLAMITAAMALPRVPVVLSSVRDILAPPSKPSKAMRADEVISAMYDGVLVHSDARVVDLSASWPVSETLAPRLHYTGFVAPPLARR